jgi:hypothetical protein
MRSILFALTVSFFAVGCADRSVDPWSDSGPDPMTDAGDMPTPDAGPTPVVDSGPTPTPDAGTPPVEDAGSEPTPDAGPPPPVDNDGDGSPVDVDCDDMDPSAHPGAAEVCDAVDNDCDGLLNEGGVCPQWRTCTGDRADFVDIIVDRPELLGECGGHWTPHLLLDGWSYPHPGGGNLACEPLYWGETGAFRVGFQCSSDRRWLVGVPDGRTATDAGVTVRRYFGGCGSSDPVEDISSTTTWVTAPWDASAGDNGTRMQVYLHSGCSHGG